MLFTINFNALVYYIHSTANIHYFATIRYIITCIAIVSHLFFNIFCKLVPALLKMNFYKKNFIKLYVMIIRIQIAIPTLNLSYVALTTLPGNVIVHLLLYLDAPSSSHC